MAKNTEQLVNPYIGGATLTRDEWDTIKRLLRHSWGPTPAYDQLTGHEQNLVTQEMFDHLKQEIMR